MIRSMTGYGNAQKENEQLIIAVEAKSLNSKFLELNIKLPREWSDKEIELRNLATSVLERGKVNISIDKNSKGSIKPKLQVNMPMFRAYYEQLLAAAVEVQASADDVFKMAMAMPEATISDATASSNDTSEEDWQLLLATFQEALEKCNAFKFRKVKRWPTKCLSMPQISRVC